MVNDTLDLPWAILQPWRSVDCGPGWFPLLADLDRDLRKVYPDYRVVQVKEKFGGLRFYIDAVPEGVYDRLAARIREAEALAAVTCERCGAAGSLRQRRHWWRTLCDTHNDEWQRV